MSISSDSWCDSKGIHTDDQTCPLTRLLHNSKDLQCTRPPGFSTTDTLQVYCGPQLLRQIVLTENLVGKVSDHLKPSVSIKFDALGDYWLQSVINIGGRWYIFCKREMSVWMMGSIVIENTYQRRAELRHPDITQGPGSTILPQPGCL